MRVLWMAEELCLKYTHVPWEADAENLKKPTFLALNPAGTIPTIVDDGFALAESLAINLYLAKKYGVRSGSGLYPYSSEGEAGAIRWSLWAQGHLEPWVQKDRDLTSLLSAIRDEAQDVITRSLEVLDRALADRTWLLSGAFSVADLNVAAVLSPSRSSGLDLSGHANVSAWLQRCYARPAAKAVRRRFET